MPVCLPLANVLTHHVAHVEWPQALGGSVTDGHGTPHPHLEAYHVRFCDWLRSSFASSGGTVECINSGMGGAQSEFVSVCLHNIVANDTDIIFLEFRWGWAGSGGRRKKYEQLASDDNIYERVSPLALSSGTDLGTAARMAPRVTYPFHVRHAALFRWITGPRVMI